MANQSKIQWTDATWNIAVGCTKVDSDCKFCYMYRDSFENTRYDPQSVRKTKTVFNLPLKLKEPSKIFTSSFTDFFHPDCDEFRNEAWDIIRKCPQHIFQILTKRPERISECLPIDWGSGWENVWLGTSAGNQQSANIRVPKLLSVNAKVKFLSIEPLYEYIDLTMVSVFPYHIIDSLSGITKSRVEFEHKFGGWVYTEDFGKVDWVIVGGESGNENGKYQYRPCELKWIASIVEACKRNDVPVFVKQLGTYLAKELKLSDRHGGNIDDFPEYLQIRQFPNKRL